MNSVGENCNELKKQYDTCFNSWFSEHFLKGNANDDVCAPLFKVYQECVKTALKDQKIDLGEIEHDVLGTEKEKEIPTNEKMGS
ncbi:TP53-regulated inhibitor of apoptosis 1-like [Ischnura elegans]|uniref:TP53-regulated inhibitor of apoptosis 1-like n=1 Tax=Ischnura elegans TaxID=197161 RepID=UPI001ED87BD2|nr:TP53-regulated inhibitor of apoptosis 1-like [Ischnura elegans]